MHDSHTILNKDNNHLIAVGSRGKRWEQESKEAIRARRKKATSK